MTGLPKQVRIVEVGPRDGLQNEAILVPVDTKIEFIRRLAASGLTNIEVSSCVSPKWVPQLADCQQVVAGLASLSGVRMPVLVPNIKGLERAVAYGAREISIMASASEGFSQKNNNCSVEEGLRRCAELHREAERRGLPVRAYVSCCLGCPYEGRVPISRVKEVAQELRRQGSREIVLSDTIGTGTPGRVGEMIAEIAGEVPVDCLAVHFHDTYGMAIANIVAALQQGVAVVDSAVAGLGGCPYARGASGNVATEEVVYLLDGLGIESGVALAPLVAAGHYICESLGRQTGSKAARAMRAQCTVSQEGV